MSDRKLDIAFWNYDRTRALMDTSVKIHGIDAHFHTARIVPQIFEAMIRQRAYDVSELGFTYFLRVIDQGEQPFVAIPVFPNRAFRHSAIYINKNSGIARPGDLNGKRVGELAVYSHDAGIMAKGMLADEFGFQPETCRWIVGGINFPMDPIDFIPQPHPANVSVETAAKGVDLGDLLERGEIDALISADIPRCVLEGSTNVGPLFDDHVSVERDYYRRTGVFPIMHTVVVTHELAEQEPELVKSIYHGFCQAKDAMAEQLVRGMTFNSMAVMVPWLPALIAADRALLGKDWWPYGMKANAAAIDAVLRYHHEQGITKRRFTAEDVFVPYLLDT
jgi:hypothetical protein